MSEINAQLQAIALQMRAGQWNAAHDAVQRHDGLLAAWLHGLLHLQEGDLEDAENWYERAGLRFRQRGTLQQELARFDAALRCALGPAREPEADRPRAGLLAAELDALSQCLSGELRNGQLPVGPGALCVLQEPGCRQSGVSHHPFE